MYREPPFITLLKLFSFLFMIFAFLMMWWSMGEQESLLKEIRETLKSISIIPLDGGKASPKGVVPRPVLQVNLDANNLLKVDPYYENILPKQLGKDFIPAHTLRGSALGKPDNLNPFSNWAHVNEWLSLCGVTAGRSLFGIFESLSPNMAFKMEAKEGGKEYWIYLRKGVFWQPLEKKWFPDGFELADFFLTPHPVTAHDYKFYYDAVMNLAIADSGAVARRIFFEDMESVEVVDDLTLVVKWKKPKYVASLLTAALKPLPEFVYKYYPNGKKIVEGEEAEDTYRKNSVWAFNFTNHWAKNIIVGCGAWLFDGMSDRMISLKRNPNHYFPLDALSERQEIAIKSSRESIWQDFKEEKLDTFLIPPQQLLDLENFLASPYYLGQKSRIKKIEYPDMSYVYVGWNQKKKWFGSKKVRQALTLAIDRERIIRQTLNGQGYLIHGTFFQSSPANNPAIVPWPFDPQKAKHLLEEEGWFDREGSGIRSKKVGDEVIPFAFTLTYFVKNTTSKAIAEYIAGALKQVGIEVSLNGVDQADISKVFEDKEFDALLLAWALGGPPEDPRQLWISSEADKMGSSNAVGFKNKEADAIIEQLDFETDRQKRIALYHRFDEILHEEQPYTFLYTPKATLLYRDWMQNIFIPADKQEWIPGANVMVPDLTVSWIER